jgi:ABC-type nitrate/sulfonate/bicarbonate transport system permease component
MTARMVERRWPLSVAFALAVVAIWQVLVLASVAPDYVLAPSRIVAAFFDQLLHEDLLSATGATLLRVVPGLAIGAGLGVVLGLLAGGFRRAEQFFDSIVSMTYPLPKISLFPIFVVALGFSDTARIIVIALTVFYPVFVNALVGTRTVAPQFVWAARNFGAGRVRTFLDVVLPGAMPTVLVGLRIGLAVSFVVTFSTEAIGAGQSGLGVEIQEAYASVQYQPMYAGIAMFALLGFAADVALRLAASRLLRGQRLETMAHA